MHSPQTSSRDSPTPWLPPKENHEDLGFKSYDKIKTFHHYIILSTLTEINANRKPVLGFTKGVLERTTSTNTLRSLHSKKFIDHQEPSSDPGTHQYPQPSGSEKGVLGY